MLDRAKLNTVKPWLMECLIGRSKAGEVTSADMPGGMLPIQTSEEQFHPPVMIK
jgi:hypothetical protein